MSHLNAFFIAMVLASFCLRFEIGTCAMRVSLLIKLPNSRVISVEVGETTKMSDLKTLISDSSGIAEEHQTLLVMGKAVKDEETVEDRHLGEIKNVRVQINR